MYKNVSINTSKQTDTHAVNSGYTDILEYWRAIELFTAPNIPNPLKADGSVYHDCKSPLPWESDYSSKRNALPIGKLPQYQIFCGVYDSNKINSILEDKFGKDPESFDERESGESCICTFTITSDGRPLFEAFTLSTCAWAIGKLLNANTDSREWLDDFCSVEEDVKKKFAEIFSIFQDDKEGVRLVNSGINIGRKLQGSDIIDYTQHIIQHLGIELLVDHLDVRIKSFAIIEKNQYETNEEGFLNSFFEKELSMLSREISKGNIGSALKNYLLSDEDLNKVEKIDIRKDKNIHFRQLSPALFPTSCWPGKGHYPLVFSQQFAINSITQSLMNSTGLFAVNGPPGTGKTTLLRDLIAAVVVERATRLSDLKSPQDAFVDGAMVTWKTGNYKREISIWKEHLSGFGIVVTSYNNGAVENISKETPQEGAVDPCWLVQPNYFDDFASILLEEPAWALVAACLGKKANKNAFVSRFWYGDKSDTSDGLNPALAGFMSYLKKRKSSYPKVSWVEAVAKFKQALLDEEEIRKPQIALYQKLGERIRLHGVIAEREACIINKEQSCLTAHKQLTEDNCQLNKTSMELDANKKRRIEHRLFRPGLIEIIMSFGKDYKAWKNKDRKLAFEIEISEGIVYQKKQSCMVLENEITSIKNDVLNLKNELDNLRTAVAKIAQDLLEAKENGTCIPDVDNWDSLADLRELSSPWANPEWNNKRTVVFLEALNLHKAFIDANAEQMLNNLWGAIDILSGNIPPGIEQAGAKAAWDSLFFTIPVISTTFASFDRLFSHLKREDIGWLLIDEAGQAPPQAAAGAIWRSKRAVVVGDPLQLEPVITIPFTAQQALRRYFKIDETWIPGNTSVQQIADRSSSLGTYLKKQNGEIWVGSPLRVHRRCTRPMFDISNEIAYDGLMVYGVIGKKNCMYPSSFWIDVKNTGEADGHWISSEGEVLLRLIEQLTNEGLKPRDLFLISPFRSVVKNLQRIAIRYTDLRAGTIHTVQGKEAEVVILVLGTETKSIGARVWAASKPNLLNVASSRAKSRLYVIGDRQAWQMQPYFDVAAKYLAT